MFIKNRSCSGPYSHGYTGYREVCYYTALTGSNPTWSDADAECRSNGGRLAVPKSQEEMQFIYDRTNFADRKMSWLGVSDMNFDGI